MRIQELEYKRKTIPFIKEEYFETLQEKTLFKIKRKKDRDLSARQKKDPCYRNQHRPIQNDGKDHPCADDRVDQRHPHHVAGNVQRAASDGEIQRARELPQDGKEGK